LVYSTYLGPASGGSGIALDTSGNAYVTGSTSSGDFPTTPGAFQTSGSGVFISKVNSAGSALIYSTFLTGSGGSLGFGIAVGASGNAYVTGLAFSGDFPITPGALQTTFVSTWDGYYSSYDEDFVTKFNADGSALVYSTFLGPSSSGPIWTHSPPVVAIDSSGSAYVTGAAAEGFPTTPGAFQDPSNQGRFVAKLNAAGSALVYSTSSIGASAIAVDSAGDAYITGGTGNTLPTTSGAFQTTFGGSGSGPGSCNPNECGDGLVTELNADGSALIYSSYLGGSDIDWGSGIAVDASGNIYVTGSTYSANFPTTPGAVQIISTLVSNNSVSDAFVVKIGPTDVPGLALGPWSLSFPAQGVGGTSVAQSVQLWDASGQPLPITSIVASGDFGQTNDCGTAVLPSVGCTIAVTFSPTATGTRTGAITINDGAPGSPHQVSLTGTGSVGLPAVSLTPATVDFELLRTVGSTIIPHTVTLTNAGYAQLNVAGVTLTGANPGDFAQSNNCTPSVAPGGNCVITVTFTPTAQGVRTASVSIADNAAGSPQTVALTGRGTFLYWAPRDMYMGEEPVGTSSPVYTVKVSNAGTAPISLYSITIGGVNPGDFTQANTCGSSLNPGASCAIEVTFTPTAVGPRLGHVAIQDSAFGGTQWVGLLGQGE
jgi:hypothetical protein